MADNAKRIAELEAELAKLRRSPNAPNRDAGLVSRNQEEAEHNQKLVDAAVDRLRGDSPRIVMGDNPDPVRPDYIKPADESNLPLALQSDEARAEASKAVTDSTDSKRAAVRDNK